MEWWQWLLIVLGAVGGFALLLFTVHIEERTDWNNGICDDSELPWLFSHQDGLLYRYVDGKGNEMTIGKAMHEEHQAGLELKARRDAMDTRTPFQGYLSGQRPGFRREW